MEYIAQIVKFLAWPASVALSVYFLTSRLKNLNKITINKTVYGMNARVNQLPDHD